MSMEEKKKNNSPNQSENVGGRPQKYTPDELYQKSQEYFKHCNDTIVETSYWKKINIPKTLSWLCLWLKVSKDYISEKLKDESFSEMIKYIRWVVENDIEEKAMLWVYNPTIASKNLSANFDWKEKSEVDNKISWELKTDITDWQAQLIANRIINGQRDNTSITTTE